ncbi:MAG: BACON domain-containing protein [Bacteroidales bacterium]|nr:BACON domain-containing protein [Bacteroidales bacterium]
MKLSNIISALFAGALFIVGCTEENPISVSELSTKLTPSVAGLAVEGTETATIAVDAKEAWTASSDSTWVHFTPASGAAGKSSVTVSVDENKGRERTATIAFKSTSGKSIFTVIQAGVPHGLTADDPLTCKEAQDICKEIGENQTTSKWYYVKGIITQIVEEYGLQYGNGTFYIGDEPDDEKVFEVYRALYIGNKKYDDINLQNVHKGDIVVVYSPLTNYKGTAETVQNTGYLISIEEGETASISLEAASMDVESTATQAKFNVKGNNLLEKITVSTTAEWIKTYTQELEPAGGEVVVTFDANEASESRTAEFTISSEEVEGEPLKFTLTQAEHLDKGTADTPYTVAEALEATEALADNGTSSGDVYVKGVVSRIDDIGNDYGNATYYISDTGTEVNQFEIFRGKGIDGAKFEAEDLAVGDIVVVKGKLKKYVSSTTGDKTLEMNSGNVLVSRNTPVSVAAALAVIDALENGKITDEYYYVKGMVYGTPSISTSYGNATIDISDDGTETNGVRAFRAFDFFNQKFTDDKAVKTGDTVTFYGKLQKFVKNDVVTPEIVSGYLVANIPATTNP